MNDTAEYYVSRDLLYKMTAQLEKRLDEKHPGLNIHCFFVGAGTVHMMAGQQYGFKGNPSLPSVDASQRDITTAEDFIRAEEKFNKLITYALANGLL